MQELVVYVRKESGVLALNILCIMSSCILILFYICFTHHMEQVRLDAESNEKIMNILFYNGRDKLPDKIRRVKDKTVQKGDLMEMLLDMDEKVFKNCIDIEMACKFDDDVVEDAGVDTLSLAMVIDFMIEDGKIIVPPNFEKKIIGNGMLVDGRYFTQEEFDNKRLLCIAYPEKENQYTSLDKEMYSVWKKKYMSPDNGTYIIDGLEFECIGHAALFTKIPRIPATVLRDDVFVMELILEYKNVVPRHAYDTISTALKERYGELAEVRELKLRRTDFERYDKVIMIMVATVCGLSLIVISVLYTQLIMRRKDCFRVYRLCGMEYRSIVSILLDEITLIVLCALIMGILIYHLILLPCLANSFEYLPYSVNISLYTVTGLSYIFISRFVLRIVIMYKAQGIDGEN